jgi:hypothetical protein
MLNLRSVATTDIRGGQVKRVTKVKQKQVTHSISIVHRYLCFPDSSVIQNLLESGDLLVQGTYSQIIVSFTIVNFFTGSIKTSNMPPQAIPSIAAISALKETL